MEDGVVPVRLKRADYRVIVNFISDSPHKDRLIKEYYVWLDENYAHTVLSKAGKKHLEQEGKIHKVDIAIAAMKIAQDRYKESGNETPSEDGAFWNYKEIELIDDAKNFIHPAEKS